MKIGIDASRYNEQFATGVELYSREIIDGIVREYEGNSVTAGQAGRVEIVLYSRAKLGVQGNYKNRVIPAKRFWTLGRLSLEMLFHKPDVLFVPSHVLPFFAPKRSVITIHDVAFKHMRSVYSLKQYLYLNWSTKYAVRHASKIIVPSEATREDLVNLFNCPEEKIVVIPHGFSKPHVERISFDDCEIFKHYDLDENSKYFFFVGRLESKKNLERLVEAFADFAREHEDYKLVLAGMRGVGFKKIWKRVTDNGLRDKVIMPGYVTSEEKDLLFRHCAGFVFPSLYEGFGFPVLDAFYYGKPVISADTSSLTEVCGKAALLVNPLKSEEIYVAMKRIVEEEGFSELLVTKGLEQLEKFSWEESIKKTLKVLNDGK